MSTDMLRRLTNCRFIIIIIIVIIIIVAERQTTQHVNERLDYGHWIQYLRGSQVVDCAGCKYKTERVCAHLVSVCGWAL